MSGLRQAARRLAQAPWLAGAAVLALGLGIGVNTALFSAARAVLLRPLPFTDEERLVIAWEHQRSAGQEQREVSHPNYEDWGRESRSFSGLFAMPRTLTEGLVLTGAQGAERLRGTAVSGSFFEVLGARPVRGVGFSPADDAIGARRVLVLSHGAWQRHFGGAPDVVGRTVELSHTAFTIVGVMGPDFAFPAKAEFWTPLRPAQPAYAQDRRPGWLHVVGRLRPGVTPAMAEAELTTLVKRLARAHGRIEEGRGAVVTPLAAHLVGRARPALLLLLAAVGVVLLMACGNVATLLLAQATRRRRETAVRIALGATPARLVRAQLAEAAVLSGAGVVTGLLLAEWVIRLLVAQGPADIPRLSSVSLDPSAFAFAALAGLVTTLLSSLAPAGRALKITVIEGLSGSRGNVAGMGRTGRVLVAAEAALAVVVVVSAGLLARTLFNLENVELGFRQPARVLSLELDTPDWKYPEQKERRILARTLLERVRALPGVEAAAAVLLRPLEMGPIGINAWYLLPGQPDAAQQTNPVVNYQVVTPDYFRAMGVPVHGREFAASDHEGAAGVVIVGQSTARKLWPGRDALGQQIATTGAKKDAQGRWPFLTVVGVAADVRHRELELGLLDLYVPLEQSPFSVGHLMVRSTVPAPEMVAAVRREVQRLDPEIAVGSPATLAELVDTALAGARFRALLLALLATLALVLAAVGLYAMVAFSVSQRTSEIGVRRALGAGTRDILGLVIGDAVRPALLGMGAGALLALGLARLAGALLFGVSPADPATILGTAALLSTLSVAVAAWPGRLALRVDPAVALRGE